MASGAAVLKVAVTLSAALIVIVQVPVPLQAALPLQPVNVEPTPAAAVSTTLAFELKFAVHVVPQLMPVGELVTVPVPVPAFVTVNANCDVLNVAVTLCAALIVIAQVPVPLHAALPLHPVNVLPLFGVAVSVTTVALAKFAEHVLGHVMPAGELVTVPVPVPASVTVNANVVVVLNVAVTLSAALIVIVHVPVPLQAALPVQPANVEPVPAAAVNITGVPLAKLALHVVPQLIPAGELVTVPVPVPAFVTVKANVVVLNVAVTASAAFIVTTHVPVPLHPAPLHPANVEPLPPVAVSVTTVALLKFAEQVEGHVIPAGLLVTVPEPDPASVTVSANWIGLNVAVTLSAALIVTAQVPVPLHPAPLHPAKVEPLPGVAVKVTTVPPL
jgi:hypothetical protein